MMDNAKAFDRLQHAFMMDVLQAFNLPTDIINAVRALYNGAETRVKLNGQLGGPFPNTSGVKQGDPVSGLLFILVQEVQLRMIRDDPSIKGIPIPGPDGRVTAPAAMRLQQHTHALKERGLVDDTMVALASRESIPPLLRVLDRFEAMSNHRMNISKTMVLLLGRERSFDLQAGTKAAQALRHRGLARTYDITPGMDDRLPDKWHGIVLGNEAGTKRAWEDNVRKAGVTADSLHACPMPHGSRGRVALAQGKLMGKAFATLRLTAPSSQATVEASLAALQKHANGLVFGRRWWLTGSSAMQPRHAFGVGHLHVAKYMQAAWAQPLLDAMGRTQEDRPYKHYFAHYARSAYPELDMGRELLTLNLSFARVEASPPEAMPGEARQAFMAIAALPPLMYVPPDELHEQICTDRGDLAYPDLVRLPLLNNPMLDATPAEGRATPEEEEEMMRWASHGVTRVRHVLDDAGRHVMKPHELAKRYPGLVGTGSRRDGVRRMYAAVTRNLNRWTHVLAAGRQEHVQAGQFRHDAAGRLLRAEATASHGETTVPASICEIELQSGHIRVTEHTATLPAAAKRPPMKASSAQQCVSNASQMKQEMTKNATIAGRAAVDVITGRASTPRRPGS